MSSRSVRTTTKTVNGVTTKITEETVVGSDGKKTVTTTEEVIEGDKSSGGRDWHRNAGKDDFNKRFDDFRVSDKIDKTQGSSKTEKKQSLKDFRKDALKSHNTHRSKHGVSSLKMSDELNDYAQKWADHLAQIRTLQHSPCELKGERLGENCAMKSSSAGADYTGDDVTDYWYSEITQYNSYGKEPPSNSAGHYTQVIWKDSKEMGIGKALDGKGGVYVVGSYRPPGNVRGKYGENVQRAK